MRISNCQFLIPNQDAGDVRCEMSDVRSQMSGAGTRILESSTPRIRSAS